MRALAANLTIAQAGADLPAATARVLAETTRTAPHVTTVPVDRDATATVLNDPLVAVPAVPGVTFVGTIVAATVVNAKNIASRSCPCRISISP